jgi:predicted nucleic acid-binding protein
MKSAVLDTSALVRVYVPDGPLPPGLDDWLDAACRMDAVIFVPGLAFVEATQVLRKKERAGLLTREETDEILSAILELPLESVPDRDLVAPALEIARNTELTVYDALFIALARARRADLLTADEELARAWRSLAT